MLGTIIHSLCVYILLAFSKDYFEWYWIDPLQWTFVFIVFSLVYHTVLRPIIDFIIEALLFVCVGGSISYFVPELAPFLVPMNCFIFCACLFILKNINKRKHKSKKITS